MLAYKFLGGFAALAVVGGAQFASAAVAWSQPSGSNGVISYSGGQSDNGYFGDPTVNGSTFTFTPSGFVASASGGSAQTTSDRASFKVTSVTGTAISSITIHAFGDWSILGAGAAVQEAGALFLTSLAGPTTGQTFSASETVSYTPTGGSPTAAIPSSTGSGLFDGLITINLPAGVTSVQFVLNDILQAVSSAGSTAFIQKKGEGGPGGTTTTGGTGPQIVIGAVLPEPASMSILLLGGAAMLRRRRPIA